MSSGLRRTLSIVGTPRREPKVALARITEFLARLNPEDAQTDLVRLFQRRVAALLSKESALLLPTGTMAQQIALRVHAEQTGSKLFAAHPTSHVLRYERDGYAVVHGLRTHRLGEAHRLLETSDFDEIPDRVAAVLWELPQRELGGLLPQWADVLAQVDRVRSLGGATHLDGARLFEAAAGYGMTPDAIAAPFDTVYVSLYKSLEAPRGAVLAGDRTTIRSAWNWALRLGGDSSGNWPLAAFALAGLDELVPQMDRYLEHARAIAAALTAETALDFYPRVPETALLHLCFPHPATEVAAAHDAVMVQTDVQLFRAPRPTTPTTSIAEIAIGEGALDVRPEEVTAHLTAMLRLLANDHTDKESTRD